MTAIPDVPAPTFSCRSCGETWKVYVLDAAAEARALDGWQCPDCRPSLSPDTSLLHDPGDLPKGAVWLGLGAFLALVAIAGGFFWFIGRTRGAW